MKVLINLRANQTGKKFVKEYDVENNKHLQNLMRVLEVHFKVLGYEYPLPF